MKIILENVESKEQIIVDNVEVSSSIIDLKLSMKKAKSYSIDTIQLYTQNNSSINDSEFIGKFVNSSQNMLNFKYKIDKSSIKILVEIYEKVVERISFNLSYSTSIFLLKKLLEYKTKIPFQEQLIYLNNMNLQDDDTFFELIYKNSFDRDTRSRSVERNSTTTDVSSPRITMLKLLRKKSSKGLGFGLDFSFNYMKNLHKMNWDNMAPSFREIEDGMSIICYCSNGTCVLYNQMFVHNLGK
jgi:hypothetical protein